jgi:hypothetical protein
MQPTELQVQRSLQALRQDCEQVPEAGLDRGDPCEGLPDGLVEQLRGASAVRDDRLALARERLERGDQPSAEDLAQRMVGRLVCDRLR